MKRTISTMVGRGSVRHNNRDFHAQNTAPERSHPNITYCHENIKDVYHELFDEALAQYNAKQTRDDRRIADYYEKIRTGKQEKPFYEIILQVGNLEDMNAQSENGELAAKVLDEYMRGFQGRNPQLRVFSAHLHMDEATPHLHVDFVPFVTGSKRGLDTRVSLKQALAAQGFKGGSKGNTEWNQWADAEKEQLAAVMQRHGIEWEKKGTHKPHLEVLDYKIEQRGKELAQLEDQIAEKEDEIRSLFQRIQNYEKGNEELDALSEALDTAPEYQLPEPQGLMTAKVYRTKLADPLIKRLKALVKSVLAQCIEAWNSYYRLNAANGRLYRENERLRGDNQGLTAENEKLKAQNRDYALMRKAFGGKQTDELLERARELKKSKQRGRRVGNSIVER